MQDENFPLPVIPCLHLLRCVNILQRQSKKTTFIALKKVCKGRKRKERENEDDQGRQKMFFGKSKEVKSRKDELGANLMSKQGNDERKQFSSTLPLHARQDWYVERGRNESQNRARLQSRTNKVIDTEGGSLLGTNRSTVGGTLQQNLKQSEKKSR